LPDRPPAAAANLQSTPKQSLNPWVKQVSRPSTILMSTDTWYFEQRFIIGHLPHIREESSGLDNLEWEDRPEYAFTSFRFDGIDNSTKPRFHIGV
jgi:hypothetical protein